MWICCCSTAQSCLTVGPWTAAHQASLFFTTSWSLLKLNVHWVSDATQPSQPLSPPSPLALNFSQHQGLFQRVSSSNQVAKEVEFQLQHQSFQWIFRIDFLLDWSFCSPWDFQESSPAPQFNSINSSAFNLLYGPALTPIHDYWEKNLALTVWTFVSKVMSLLFNLLSRFVAVFLPRSKRLLVSWLQALSAVILELRKRKSSTVSTFPTSICLEAIRLDTMIFFWMLSF